MKKTFAYKIYSKDGINKINKKICMLGNKSKVTVDSFLNLRFIGTIFTFVTLFVIFKKGYIIAPIVSILVYFGSEYIFLDYPAMKIAKVLEKEALFFFEIFSLTLESGRTLKHALTLTTNNIDSELSNEFKKTLEEVRLGKSLNDALEDMKKRIPSEAINNTILNMVEANLFGTNIVLSIDNQLQYLRNKQLLNVKETIQKLPTKVSIISVVFFVPIMMLIILAPLLIRYLLK